MKRLYLLRSTRHRTTGHVSLADYHRPLTRRGELAAITMGKTMQKNGYTPDLVICAAPTRTRQTLANAWPHLHDTNGNPPELVHDYRIHLMRGEAMLRRLHEIEARFERVMMVSITPGISDLADLLNQPNMATPDAFSHGLPVGGLAVFDCNVEAWTALTPACGALVKIVS